jgi:hypothetical protein
MIGVAREVGETAVIARGGIKIDDFGMIGHGAIHIEKETTLLRRMIVPRGSRCHQDLLHLFPLGTIPLSQWNDDRLTFG